MAIWKEQSPVRREPIPASPEASAPKPLDIRVDNSPTQDVPRRVAETKESVIAADLTIEGKIEGSGHVRIAGRFKGDVNVQGNLTIEPGAKLSGGVRANTVITGGELEGNIDAASRVELLQTGMLNGDLKAGSLIVAAGSRMRGQVEFGWEDKGVKRTGMSLESGSAA